MAYSNYYAASGLFHGSMSSVMGTQFDILMVGSDPRLLGTVWEKVESEVQRLDKMLNRFDPESEVSFVNREAGHYPVTVGEELWNILLNCKRYNELTEGYYDITLQGFDQVLLTEEDKSIFFFSESLHIDLGGYGKGYALAKIRELLEENGIGKALVNFGNSSVLAVGTHPCGEYWPGGLDNPFTKERIADLKLSDSSLSISGNMPSHPRHIVNPHTGTFVEDKKMVSVVAKDPVVAEILTTAFMICGDERVPVIVICLGFRIESRSLFQVGRIIITQGNHIGIRNRLQVIQMVLSTRTCTDKSDPHLFLCDLHLIVGTTGLQPGKRGKQHTASTNHSQLLEEVPPA